MLPGPLLPPPPSPPLVLIGYRSVPSVSPSATPSSSIGSSIAIVVVVVIATVVVTCAIVVLRRSYRRHRLSWSTFSPRCSLSPTASSSSSSAEYEMQCVAAAAVGASSRANASKSLLEMAVVSSAPNDAGKAPPVASVAHSTEGSVKGTELVAPSAVLVPSAPSLPEVERVILELLSLPPGPMKPGSSTVCSICNHDFLPTDMLLALPVCSHTFHQSCIVTWLRCATPPRCPFCHASITIPFHGTANFAPAFCPDEYDIEAQMLVRVPTPPGEEVAEAVGGSRGWLRSSLDRLSGSWRGCSSNRATAVVVPVSSRRTTGSWSVDSSGHLGIDSYGIQTQMQVQLPAPPAEEVADAVGGSRGWLRSSLATLSGSWTGCSNSRSTAMVLPVYSRSTTGSLSLGSSGRSSIDPWSGSWDPEAAAPTPETPSVFNYVRWLFRYSG